MFSVFKKIKEGVENFLIFVSRRSREILLVFSLIVLLCVAVERCGSQVQPTAFGDNGGITVGSEQIDEYFRESTERLDEYAESVQQLREKYSVVD